MSDPDARPRLAENLGPSLQRSRLEDRHSVFSAAPATEQAAAPRADCGKWFPGHGKFGILRGLRNIWQQLLARLRR